MGSKKKQTVGYRYYLGVHMGVAHGPVDALLEIRAGDRTAWSGFQTVSGQIAINAPELFGGESKEGGLTGTLDVMMGEPTQTTNGYLAAQLGTPQPAYRGILGLVYRGLIAANNPYIKPWAMRVRRILAGWNGGAAWYSAKAAIDLGGGLKAMNPAHIAYECLTNPQWGMGYPTGSINDTAFRSAADTFYAEGLGLCLAWLQQDKIESFVQLVMDHAGAILTEDPTTGLFLLKPLRGDYTLGTLPEFSDTAGNVIELQSFERASGLEAANEVTVKYVDALTGKDGSVTVQNLAAIQSQGAVVSEQRSYAGLPTAALATRMAQRDVQAATSCLGRVRLLANREAYGVAPGDVIRFAWTPLGIDALALRVVDVDYGNLTNGTIQIDAVEDVFGLPAASYVAPPVIGWTPPDLAPKAATIYRAEEASYRELVETMGATDAAALDSAAGFIIAAAGPPAGVPLDFELWTKATSGSTYATVDDAGFCPAGKLAGAIGPTTTTITLTDARDLDKLTVGEPAWLGPEIVKIAGVNAGANQVTIARGCTDTVPQSHASGTAFVGYGTRYAGDPTQWTSGDQPLWKIATRTGSGTLAEGSAPGGSILMASRANKPYPPGKLRIAGAAYPSAATQPFDVTWAHRDRGLQADQLVDTEAASIGPEAGVTYEVVIRRTDTSTVLVDASGIAGTSYSVSATYSGEASVEVFAWRGATKSRLALTHTLYLNPP